MKTLILKVFLLCLITGFYSCSKDNELTPNPVFGEKPASNDNESSDGGNNDNGNNNGGGDEGVDSFLKGEFGGENLNFNNCYFEYDNIIGETIITSTSNDGNKLIRIVINEEVNSNKVYTVGQGLDIAYDNDALNFSSDTRYIADSGELSVTSNSSTSIEGTFNFSGKIASNPSNVIEAQNVEFVAEKK